MFQRAKGERVRELDLEVQAVVDIAVVLIQMRISVLHVSERPSLQYSLLLGHKMETMCPIQLPSGRHEYLFLEIHSHSTSPSIA